MGDEAARWDPTWTVFKNPAETLRISPANDASINRLRSDECQQSYSTIVGDDAEAVLAVKSVLVADAMNCDCSCKQAVKRNTAQMNGQARPVENTVGGERLEAFRVV